LGMASPTPRQCNLGVARLAYPILKKHAGEAISNNLLSRSR